MSHDEISSLKDQQERRAAQRSDLLEQCIPFRDGLLERLAQFTTAAIENGVEGVKPCFTKTHTNKILEVAFTLNGFDLALMATDDVFPVDLGSDVLASKMFIYFEDDEENTPHIEIVVLGPVEGTYLYKMIGFAQGQPMQIAAGRSVTGKDGHAAAEALLRHFYSFRALWMDRPTLGMMRQRKYETHAIGFQALKK